ncbi:MAG TPA: M20/M25/M40 family metallo-hydrolase, partial [Anaerolineaceae bacterium]|nr:M20/M25/M40 family metallo-hydrolase [Anaerolineaceae bacterium]
ELLASLHTPDGRIAVAGFYDQVVEPKAAERTAIHRLPFDEPAYLQEVGASSGFGEPGYSLLERVWVRPTLEIVGMGGGYQGEGIKTVIPAEAHAKINCRLVPNQSPDDIWDRLCDHLRSHQPPGVRLEIHRAEKGVPAYCLCEDHPGLQVAGHVLKQIYAQDPILVRIGATLPIAEAFRNYLKADTIFFSFSTADEDYHAPNEFFRLQRLKDGLRAWTYYFEELASIEAAH